MLPLKSYSCGFVSIVVPANLSHCLVFPCRCGWTHFESRPVKPLSQFPLATRSDVMQFALGMKEGFPR